MSDELPEVHSHTGNFFQILPNRVDKLFRVSLAVTELDIKLHKIRRHRILVDLGPPGPWRHGHDLRIFPELFGDAVAEAHRLLERSSRQATHRQDEIPFMKFGQERASQKRNNRDAENEKNHGNSHQPAWMPERRKKNF